MSIVLIASLEPAPGKGAELDSAVRRLVDAAAEEPGLAVYAAHSDESGGIWFYEVYDDDAALAGHGKGPGMAAALAELGPLLAARPDIRKLSPIAAKGLDL